MKYVSAEALQPDRITYFTFLLRTGFVRAPGRFPEQGSIYPCAGCPASTRLISNNHPNGGSILHRRSNFHQGSLETFSKVARLVTAR